MTERRQPRFAVIIPVYNGAKTLARTIDSVLAQTYPAHEIIVVDDGSTDASAEIVSRYGERVRLLRQENRGVSAARNAGVAAASAEWLCFLDADDWYYPERLARHARMIERDASLDFLTGDFDYVDFDGRYLHRSMESTPAGRKVLAQASGDEAVLEGDVLGDFVTQHFGDTHTLSVPRARFLALGGYPTGFVVCEDVNFLIRLCAQSRRVGVACVPLAAYRIHSHGATRSDPLRAQQQTVEALSALLPQLQQADPAIQRGLRAGIAAARLDLASCLLRNGLRLQALKAVLPLLKDGNLRSLRIVLSVLKSALTP